MLPAIFRLSLILAISFCLAPISAHAACSNPAGVESEMLYNHDYGTMQFCNGTVWVSMASGAVSITESDPQVGTLTASNWCKANAGATAIDCTSAGISLSTDVSGTLQAAQFPALTGDVTNSAGDLATTVGKINGVALGSTAATAGNLLIGSGTAWVSNAVTGDVTITSGGVTAIGAGKVTNAMLAGSIAASKLVGTDIVTVGTITAGVWNAGAVTSSGPVIGTGAGIGTTSVAASAVLDVVSTTKGLLPPRMTTAQRDAISSPATGLTVYNTTTNAMNIYNGTAWGAVGGGGSASGADGYVQFAASGAFASDSALVWDNTNKRLGIGTATPAYSLDVTGKARSISVLFPPTAGYAAPTGTGVQTGWNISGSNVVFSGGNVGINSASPAVALDVVGAGAFTTTLTAGGAISGTVFIPSGGTAPTNGMYLPAANKVGFATNSTAALTIDSSQKVGIGSNSPAQKLDVVGNAAVSGTIVAGGTVTGATPTSSTNLTTKAYVDAAVAGASGGVPVDFQVFTSSGTWTKPGSGSMAFVQCWGGGGSATGWGGAGGGGYVYGWKALSALSSTVTVTIGAGGASGGAGGNTTFGAYLTANGGGGSTTSYGANGGSGSGSGFAVISGSPGFPYLGSNGGPGGSAGGAGGGGGFGGGNPGGGGQAPGGGAGGYNGGSGGAGECLVTVY